MLVKNEKLFSFMKCVSAIEMSHIYGYSHDTFSPKVTAIGTLPYFAFQSTCIIYTLILPLINMHITSKLKCLLSIVPE